MLLENNLILFLFMWSPFKEDTVFTPCADDSSLCEITHSAWSKNCTALETFSAGVWLWTLWLSAIRSKSTDQHDIIISMLSYVFDSPICRQTSDYINVLSLVAIHGWFHQSLPVRFVPGRQGSLAWPWTWPWIDLTTLGCWQRATGPEGHVLEFE